MNRAIEQARNTLDEYRRRLVNPPATQTGLCLKARFESGDHVEHMSAAERAAFDAQMEFSID